MARRSQDSDPETIGEEMNEEQQTAATIQPWGIEADHPRMCDLAIQSVPGCILRSAISSSKPSRDYKRGVMRINPDQAAYLGQFPPLPGMQIHVNPATLTVMIIDPLHDDKDLCKQIKSAFDHANECRSKEEWEGVPTRKEVLNAHRMKTLCREMLWLVQAGEAKVVKGIQPSMQEVAEMPGNFLLNPGSTVPNGQPQFEKDLDAYVVQLQSVGG
jgi:hypothetical protein